MNETFVTIYLLSLLYIAVSGAVIMTVMAFKPMVLTKYQRRVLIIGAAVAFVPVLNFICAVADMCFGVYLLVTSVTGNRVKEKVLNENDLFFKEKKNK